MNGRQVGGTIASFREGVLVVEMDEDHGESIPRAQLVADDFFLMERLKERMEEVRDGAKYFNRDAADRSVGAREPRVRDAEPPAAVVDDEKLNPGQIGALRKALGSDMTFVWGPPGTGKTTTLARIVEAHYREGRSVLLVSNTNIAVDTALEQIAGCLCHEPEFDEGLMLRPGTVVKEELRERFGEQVILEKIAKRLGTALEAEKEHLLSAIEPLEAEEQKHQTVLDIIDRHARAQQRLEQHEKVLLRAKGEATRRGGGVTTTL